MLAGLFSRVERKGPLLFFKSHSQSSIRSTNEALWNHIESRESAYGLIGNAIHGSATRSLVKNLRKRMEEQRKH